MELDKFLIGLLVFVAIVVGGVLIISNINENYDGIMQNNISTNEFGDVYNAADEIYNLSQDMSEDVLGGEVDEDDTADSMFKGGYASLKLLSGSFGIVGDIINAIALTLGIGAFWVGLAMTALTISIIFGMIYLIFRVARG